MQTTQRNRIIMGMAAILAVLLCLVLFYRGRNPDTKLGQRLENFSHDVGDKIDDATHKSVPEKIEDKIDDTADDIEKSIKN